MVKELQKNQQSSRQKRLDQPKEAHGTDRDF